MLYCLFVCTVLSVLYCLFVCTPVLPVCPQVGNIVRVDNNTELPCDLVLLSSPHDEGQAYIMTANLDGETNLKVQTLSAIWPLVFGL